MDGRPLAGTIDMLMSEGDFLSGQRETKRYGKQSRSLGRNCNLYARTPKVLGSGGRMGGSLRHQLLRQKTKLETAIGVIEENP